MHLKYLTLSALALIVLPNLPNAWAGSGPEIAIGPAVTSTGLGIEASTPLIHQWLNLNTGIAGFGFNFTVSADNGSPGSTYKADARIGSIPIFLSYYPFGNWFNVQGGIYFNANRITFTSDYFDHGHDYGETTGSTHYNIVAPFVGIGFGQPFSGSRFTFTGNLGVSYAGGPGITLHPTQSLINQLPKAAAQIESNESELNSKTKWTEFYPVFSLGVAYRF